MKLTANGFVEDELQLENEDDVESFQKAKSNAVVSANDWTTETILTQIDKGNIQLNPDFQRRDAWDKRRKSKFIESLILGLPVPQLVLAESKTKRGAYIVLDGKQRLLTIRQFAAELDDSEYETLKITGLELRKDLNGQTLADMKTNPLALDDLSSFENQSIRTVVVKNWPNEDFLYHVFLRLNTGSVSLSPQELRQALHPGSFVKFIDKQSANSLALKQILKIEKPDFRMRDAELLLRYFAFRNFLSEYSGGLKLFLDTCCQTFNKTWLEKEEEIKSQLLEFEEAHKITVKIFGESAYKKWAADAYENRFNRAIFDIMMIAFTNNQIKTSLIDREAQVKTAFEELCAEDRDFLSAIESTTKSLSATHMRISKWLVKLNNILNINVHVPQLVNSRIV